MGMLREIKRRRVGRVVLVYAAFAYAVTEVAGVLTPALLLPDWTVRLVLMLTLLAAPVVLGLAWTFDVTRTPDGDEAPAPDIEVGPTLSLASVVGAVALIGVGLLAGRILGTPVDQDDPPTPAPSSEPSSSTRVAILPFEDLSEGGDRRAFADGMAEELIHVLSRIDGVDVAARTSSFAFRDRDIDARAIGDSLGVDAILEGSVRTDGDRLRINTQLVDVHTGFQILSQAYDRPGGSVFEIQEDLAQAIADSLRIPLGLSENPVVMHRTADFDTYELYLEARDRFNQRGPAVNDALTMLEAVVARDPSFVPAWSLMAEAYLVSHQTADIAVGIAAVRRAQEAADEALRLDSLYAPAWAAKGTLARERLDWIASESHLRRALELDPTYAEANSNLGEILFALDRLEEAREYHFRAIELEPRSALYHWNIGLFAYPPTGVSETAVHHLERAAELGFPCSQLCVPLLAGYASQGRFALARGVVDRMPPEFREATLTLVDDMEDGVLGPEGIAILDAYPVAGPGLYVRFGNPEEGARRALEIAIERPFMWAWFLGGLSELSQYPDFREARRRRGLPN